MVKKYLTSIEAELQESFTKLHTNLMKGAEFEPGLGTFVGDTVAILDYYAKPIYKQALKTLSKKSDLDFIEDERFLVTLSASYLARFEQHLKHAMRDYLGAYDIQSIHAERFYEDIMRLVVQEVVRLYKLSQLDLLKQAGCEHTLFLNHGTDCMACNMKHGELLNVDDLIDDLSEYKTDTHILCASSYNPTHGLKTSDHSIMGKLQLKGVPTIWERDVVKPLQRLVVAMGGQIPTMTFHFTDDIFESQTWDKLASSIDREKARKHVILATKMDNEVFISDAVKRPLETILRHLIPSLVNDVDTDWWNERFEAKRSDKHVCCGDIIYSQQFISKLAENSSEDYLIENAVAYVLQPEVLRILDEDAYNRLEKEVFKEARFYTG